MCSARVCFLTLLLFLAVLPTAHAQGPTAEAENLKAETLLLHHQVPLTDLVFSDAPMTVPSATVLVIHVWSMECPPCLRELPTLITIMRGYDHDPRLRFLLISESMDAHRAQAHLQRLGVSSTQILYAQGGARMRAALQDQSQPLTLLLDRHRVVRQAFRGSLLGRRTLFTSALDQLLSLSHL